VTTSSLEKAHWSGEARFRRCQSARRGETGKKIATISIMMSDRGRLVRHLVTRSGSDLKDNHQEDDTMYKNTICLWYNKDAEEAARFYADTFPDSKVGAIMRAPGNYPSGEEGDVLVVEFTVAGVACIGLNGGPMFKHSEAFSFQISTEDQEETDRYWNAIVGNDGQESECGWCKDKWGISWQITPRTLTDALAAGGEEAKRAFDAMMTMRKIDVAVIDAARKGKDAP
jgi:predicted 3-demethylubiquinone-9 3-methyltransferase (glyoxalase superfamily)